MIVEQAEGLLEGGADFILFETQPNRPALERLRRGHAAAAGRALRAFVRHRRAVAKRPRASRSSGCWPRCPPSCPQPVAWGMNCGSGPDGLLGAVERAVRADHAAADRAAQRRHAQGSRKPPHLLLLAGVSGRAMPSVTWAWARRRWAAAAAPRPSTSARWPRPSSRWRGRRSRRRLTGRRPASSRSRPRRWPRSRGSAGRLASRQWVTTVELLPPRGYDLPSTDRQEPRRSHERGVDAINIPDGPRASARISPLVTAERIQQEAGIEADPALLLPRPQPDRHAGRPAGLRGLRHPQHPVRHRRPAQAGRLSARHRRVRRRFDRHGGRAAAAQRRHRPGRPGDRPADLRRDRRGAGPHGPGPAARAGPLPPEGRGRRRVRHHASRSSTPTPCCGSSTRSSRYGMPILAGIWPLASYRNASFMRNEVPGVVVPDAIMERMASVESREEQLAMGIEIARESVARLATAWPASRSAPAGQDRDGLGGDRGVGRKEREERRKELGLRS